MDEVLASRARKGRGAVSNPTGRFEANARFAVDDGWQRDDEQASRLRTTETAEVCRTIITENLSPDVPFELSINPYRGCEHGCVYCYARPSHAYLGLSPGLDFESRLYFKPEAPQLLEKELSRSGYRCRPITLGANTDPYQPIERHHRLTRRLLEVLAAHDHPVAVVTKSDLVLRDIDILAPMAARGLASVGVSVTTLDGKLARAMEPRAATPARRLAAIGGLAATGVPVTVMAAPMIPALNDSELEAILEAGEKAGATAAAYILLRLPRELKDLFTEWLEAHYPDRARRVLNQVRACRDGALYASDFGSRMKGTGVFAELLAKRFDVACKRLGLNAARAAEGTFDTGLFQPPERAGDQLNLW